MVIQDEFAEVLKDKRVVIVEDEGIMVMQLQKSLTRAGMNVVGTANNAAEAIDLILQKLPDLVLMDINMPGELNGLDAAYHVLQSVRICIVMISAYSNEEYTNRAKEIGTAGYMVKPITKTMLLPTLQQFYAQWAS